jgi:DNA-directed RNA polymerase specialized sigma24 family protein
MSDAHDDRECFEQLVRTFGGYVFYLLLGFVGELAPEQAEDLTQDVFLRLANNIMGAEGSFQRLLREWCDDPEDEGVNRRVRAYLRRVVRSVSVDWIRRGGRRSTRSLDADGELETPAERGVDHGGDPPAPDQVIAIQERLLELNEQVRALLPELPPRQREDIEAHLAGRNLGVRSNLTHAIDRLSEWIAQSPGEVSVVRDEVFALLDSLHGLAHSIREAEPGADDERVRERAQAAFRGWVDSLGRLNRDDDRFQRDGEGS